MRLDIVILGLLFFIFSACANFKSHTASNPNLKIIEDIRLLKANLVSSYGGYWFYFDERTKEKLSEEFEKLGEHLADDADFCIGLGKILDSFPDGHFYAFNDSHFCMPNKLKATVGTNLAAKQTASFLIKTRKIKNENIAILAIRNFTNHSQQEWVGFENKFKLLLKAADNLIIDLRGNLGGDSWFAEKIPLWVLKKIVNPYSKQQKVQTEAAIQLQINAINRQTDKFFKNGEPSPVSMIEMLNYFSSELAKSKEGILAPTVERIFPDLPDTEKGLPFKGKVIVLIDSVCASACEVAVLNLTASKKHNLTTIGLRTSGLVHFGNPGLLFLPHTKTYVTIPSDFSSLRNGNFIEKRGIAPDIILLDGADAYDAAIDFLYR